MIKTLTLLGALATISASVMAGSITGSIGLNGSYTVDTGNVDTATAFTSFTNVEVGTATGDFAGLSGTAVVQNTFGFNPSTTPLTLWSFSVGATTYSFDLASLSIASQGDGFLNLKGTGTLFLTGETPTTASWKLTATQAGAAFEFGDVQTAQVPDGGATAMLLGVGLLGLGALRRKA